MYIVYACLDNSVAVNELLHDHVTDILIEDSIFLVLLHSNFGNKYSMIHHPTGTPNLHECNP